MFLEPLARKYYLQGHNIYWPVNDAYKDINRYLPYINWYDGSDVEIHQTIDFQDAPNRHSGSHILKKKYTHVCEDYETWRSFDFNRDLEKERALIEHLQLDITQPYSFIHNIYATPPNIHIGGVGPSKYREIKMDIIPGFSVFDWCGVIESAYEIQVISTCTLFLIEKLHLINNPSLKLYPRHTDKNLEQVDFLLSKNWELFKY